MKTTNFYTYFLFAFLLLNAGNSYASHGAGADLQYKWLHDSTYQLTYKFYRDCAGIQEPSSVTVCYNNSCDTFSGSVTLNKMTGNLPSGKPNGSESMTVGAGTHTTCTQPSAVLPGYKEWWYVGDVTLPSKCNHWTFSHTEPSRNIAITNLVSPGSNGMYCEATLDNLHAQGNSSPVFTAIAVPQYLADNQAYLYNNNPTDPDADSMNFSMINALGSTNTNCPDTGSSISTLTFTSPYTLTHPLSTSVPFTINPNNGNIAFTPNAIQVAVVTMLVKEFRNGIQIGSLMRDIQFVVLPSATSVGTTADDQSFSIYPNPASGQFNIDLKTASVIQKLNLSIMSVTGQKLFNKTYEPASDEFNEQLDIRSLPKGLYIVVLEANGERQVRKLINQ